MKPTDSKKSTILLLHGFPSHCPDWIYQIEHFSCRGYGILAPDLLGYGQSSKPADPNDYLLKTMSLDLEQLLNHIEVERVVGVGHDFGSTLLSRFAAYHPERLVACVFLTVGPPRLGTPFNVDAINAMAREKMGSEMLGYIPFISRNRDSQQIMEKNAASVMSLLFCANEKQDWSKHFRPAKAFETFVMGGQKVSIAPWYTLEMRKAHMDALGKDGGYAGAKRWYVMWDQELFAPDEVGYEDVKIEAPSLFIGPVEECEMQAGFLKEWTEDLKVHEVTAGHWVHIEQAEQVNKLIEHFLQDHGL